MPTHSTAWRIDDWPTTWPAEPVKPSRKLCAQRNQCRIDSAHSAFARAGLAQFLAILRLVSRKFPAIPEQVSARLTRSIRHMGGDFTTGMQGIALLARRENDKGSSLFFTNKYIVLYGTDADFSKCLTSASLPDRGTDPSRARSNRHQSPPESPVSPKGPSLPKGPSRMSRIPFIHARFVETSQSRLEIAARLENHLRKPRRENTCQTETDGEPHILGIDAETRVTSLNPKDRQPGRHRGRGGEGRFRPVEQRSRFRPRGIAAAPSRTGDRTQLDLPLLPGPVRHELGRLDTDRQHLPDPAGSAAQPVPPIRLRALSPDDLAGFALRECRRRHLWQASGEAIIEALRKLSF